MFLHKYYLEIKNRFFLVLLSWSFTLIVCSAYKEALLFLVIKSTSSVINFSENSIQLYFIFTDVKELFYVYFKLIFVIANQLCMVLLFYQIFMFFYLGLYIKEYKKLKIVLKFSLIFFVVAILMSYIFIIPLSWNFFLSFQYKVKNTIWSHFFFEAKISEFFNFVNQTYTICVLSFQFLGLTLLGINSIFFKIKRKKKLKVFRKLCYFSFFLFATVVTPPDVVSQIIMSLFLILIYEIFIFVKVFFLLNKKLVGQPIEAN